MTTTGLQLLGFVLGVIAWAGMIATMASPVWRKNSVATATDEFCHPAALVGYEQCVGSSVAHDIF